MSIRFAAMAAAIGLVTTLGIPAAAFAQEGKPVELADGLKYTDTKVGDGAVAEKGLLVSVQYTGWLYKNGAKGAKFDSSLDRDKPFAFKLSESQGDPRLGRGRRRDENRRQTHADYSARARLRGQRVGRRDPAQRDTDFRRRAGQRPLPVLASRRPAARQSGAAEGQGRMVLSCQRLVEVADQIVGGFEPDRQAHDIGAGAGGEALLVGELAMRRRRRVQVMKLRVSPILARCENSRTPSTSSTSASNPPLTPKVNTAPAPFAGISAPARDKGCP